MIILIKNQQTLRRLNKARIKKAIRNILTLLRQPHAELSILFVGNRQMKELNSSFRNIDRSTDVLSFPQVEFGPPRPDASGRGRGVGHLKSEDVKMRRCEDAKSQLQSLLITRHSSLLLGDIVISPETAAKQAKMSGTDFYDEISRLLIHGILHLLGYNHEGSSPMAAVMKKKEREILNAIKKMG